MSPTNPLFALIVILITFITGYVISLKYKLKTSPTRFETIDGLRGFLAICVFIHHSNVWYKYLHTGNWVAPNSNLFNQLGQTGVTFFFMISSFLFVKILIDFNGVNYDWKSFFIKRFFRLAPLHFFITIIIIVFIQSNWMINTSYIVLIKNIVKLFITVSFTLIALGNDFLGLLKNKTLKLLGEISYSTYLVHGLIIFVMIHYIYGLEATILVSPTEYCILIFFTAPIIIFVSFLTFRFVEKPFIKRAKRFTTSPKPH